MAAEIETAYRVNTEALPDLSNVPYDDIRQVYLTPLATDTRYPETAQAEWRIREKTDAAGNRKFSSAVKFGDKKTGSRVEIEAKLAAGAFGTIEETLNQDDIDGFAYGIVQKRRYHLDETLVLDTYDHELHGNLLLAEKEFESPEHQATWQPPEWCVAADDIPSNAELAMPLQPTQNAVILRQPSGTLEDLLENLSKVQRNGHPTIATVSGVSGSGKSTVTRQLAALLDAAIVESDNFHIGASKLQELYGHVNHDLPHTYDYAHAGQVALALAAGRRASLPQYSFETAERTEETRIIEPTKGKSAVIDGLYAERAKEVLTENTDKLNIIHVLVDTPLYVSVIRRIMRDAAILDAPSERTVAFTPEESLAYIMQTALPTYLAHRDNSLFDFILRKT